MNVIVKVTRVVFYLIFGSLDYIFTVYVIPKMMSEISRAERMKPVDQRSRLLKFIWKNIDDEWHFKHQTPVFIIVLMAGVVCRLLVGCIDAPTSLYAQQEGLLFETVKEEQIQATSNERTNTESIDLVGEYIDQASERSFSRDEINALSEEQLYLIRNGIYAKHGRTFDEDYLTEYYCRYEWYNPVVAPSEFDTDLCDQQEQENILLIIEIEAEKTKNDG